ncbi:MAG: hypothetical protein OXR68_04550 [Alphaproteobacteria bacterium]|nr:hypothetical protein [Alphaproteobacteria bacterium]MDD9919878.1 hypothetical protein [Alphaproteobacteria bacterium]
MSSILLVEGSPQPMFTHVGDIIWFLKEKEVIDKELHADKLRFLLLQADEVIIRTSQNSEEHKAAKAFRIVINQQVNWYKKLGQKGPCFLTITEAANAFAEAIGEQKLVMELSETKKQVQAA